MTTGNLGKISQNFSNLASAISDCSDDDNQGYLSTYLNLSQSPEEIQKRARQLSKDKWANADTASVAAHSTVSGAKNQKSILKKTNSNNAMQDMETASLYK